MKLMFVNDGIYAYASRDPLAVGGAERQQWLLARALAASGWSIVVGVRRALHNGERRSIDRVEYVGIGAGQILLACCRLLLSERPDWWYWRGASHLWGPAAALAKLLGVRTVFSVAFDSHVRVRSALSWRPRWWPLYACGLSCTDRILLQHNGQLEELWTGWRSKAFIVPSIAAESTAYKPHTEREGYVAWIAALRYHKRPDLLIEIANAVPGARFVVCGGPQQTWQRPGYETEMVETLKRTPNIEYRGQVSPEEVQDVIGGAAVLLSTADEEGFPNTFLEAWSAGTPVVTLSVDPDQLIQGFGLGVVSGSTTNAVRDILALLNAPAEREAMGAQARRYVSAFRNAKTVASVFQNAVLS